MNFFTLGHSTRSQEEFLRILQAYGIEVVADVRAFPRSQRFPHFTKESLAKVLGEEGIEYVWLGRELGGYRRSGLGEASPNKAWNSPGFRNYADHMLTEEFQKGVEELFALGQAKRVAILCAERFWWRCHRRLLSDWLVAHGHKVIHIVDLGHTVEHELSPFAQVEGGRIIYPGGDPWSPGCEKRCCKKLLPGGKPAV
ncbi:MAG: DUF488 domain-containing protein [Candidatus Bipolaricaulota bacterium]|nr:DUF488 domain-containing protein [Candidatus Bipolaricaulota bacterium]MDW8127269.1 DUF488 domain-containing protein [Candidatus Bipolaricaulota bacterium]